MTPRRIHLSIKEMTAMRLLKQDELTAALAEQAEKAATLERDLELVFLRLEAAFPGCRKVDAT